MPTPEDWPNWYKNDWKQAFRDSEYNVRAIDVPYEESIMTPPGKSCLCYAPQIKFDPTNEYHTEFYKHYTTHHWTDFVETRWIDDVQYQNEDQ